ncbi:MAG: glycosyltransferase, partial [Isosphaeraceae bacterium]
GTVLNLRDEIDLEAWLVTKQLAFETTEGNVWDVGMAGVRAGVPPQIKLVDRGVPITLHRSPTTRMHPPDERETNEFLRLFETVAERFRPDVVIGYGGSRIARGVFARARGRGMCTVFTLHNFAYTHLDAFTDVDEVLVPSRFAAEHYRRTLGLACTALPNLVDFERARAERHEPKYVTFVTPSAEKGVFPFARIADELGRRRPEIPLLVVEGRGTEATLASCGLDLRTHGNVFLMAHTPDPRKFWRVSRLCLMPSLWRENQPLVAIEAMVNGVPVIGSDRGGIPETLGAAGMALPLPDRLTPTTRTLPEAAEVEPWVSTILRLWDDRDAYAEQRRLALAEAERWRPEVLEPRYIQVFEGVRAGRPTVKAEGPASGAQAAETSSEGPPSLRACHSSQE